MEGVLDGAWPENDLWLSKYWEGDRKVLEGCYLAHADRVWRAVREIVGGADGETVVHEVFYRMLSDESFRRSYSGGSLGAYLVCVGQNLARDQRRKQMRHDPIPLPDESATVDPRGRLDASIDVQAILAELRERVAPELHEVIELRIVRQLSQAAAAETLGVARTTLGYRERKVRQALRLIVLRRGSR